MSEKTKLPEVVTTSHVPLPEWFELPKDLELPRRRIVTQYTSATAMDLISKIENGSFMLPAWQREDVWSYDQRIRMLDSMIHGIFLGPILLWRPSDPTSGWLEKHNSIPFFSKEDMGGSKYLLLDGRQRLTTLMMAANGSLSVRWDGNSWQEGPGMVGVQMALRDFNSEEYFPLYEAINSNFGAKGGSYVTRVCNLMSSYRFSIVEIETETEEELVGSYRRLATCGSPHSLEDLQAMERWSVSRNEDNR